MMMQKLWRVLIVSVVLFLASCSGGAEATQPAANEPSAKPTPPPEYAGKTNPLAGDAAAAETGSQLYATNCTSCHGAAARGDGPAASALNPKPQDLAIEMNQLQDDYLYWRIAEGGMKAPFHSAMPAWKSILSEEQIWQVVTHLRTLQP